MELIEDIMVAKADFIKKYEANPKVLLLSRENFMSLREYHIANPEVEGLNTSMAFGMWVILNPSSEIEVAGI